MVILSCQAHYSDVNHGILLNKHMYYGLMTVSSRPMQRRIFAHIFLRDIGILIDKQPHHLLVSILSCPVKRRSTMIVSSVDSMRDLVFQEYVDNGLVASDCSLVKRSFAIFVFE